MIRIRDALLALTLGLGCTLSCAAQPAPLAARRDAQEARKLLDEAEEAYRTNDYKGAFERLRLVVDADPGHAFAWLRIGNLWQRLGDPVRAIDAYRTAAAAEGGARDTDPDPASRQKALLNLAGLAHGMLRDALRDLDVTRAPELAGARETLEAGLREIGGCPPPGPAAMPAPVAQGAPEPAPTARRATGSRPAPRPRQAKGGEGALAPGSGGPATTQAPAPAALAPAAVNVRTTPVPVSRSAPAIPVPAPPVAPAAARAASPVPAPRAPGG